MKTFSEEKHTAKYRKLRDVHKLIQMNSNSENWTKKWKPTLQDWIKSMSL